MAELMERAEVAVSASQAKDYNVKAKEAYARGKIDINFFASLLIPHVMESALPDFYVAIFKLLTTRTVEQMGAILRFALGLPRGHAKTTFIKILICWLIVYDKISFAVIICASEPLAEELLADVSEMLGGSNCETIYGKWEQNLSTDNKVLKKGFYHGRNIILAAKGAQTAMRGLNIKHQRPDLIFCDDAQTKENDESPTERLKFRKWLVAMFKIIAPKGDRLIIYVGNMYSQDCILWQLKESRSWMSMVTGAILEDGKSLWPELHSIDSLMDSYLHDEELGEADVWFAEVMNDPVNRATTLLHDSLPEYPYANSPTVPDGVFITLDPAGFRDHSDDNVIALHYVLNGKGVVVETITDLKDPEQIILATLKLAVEHGASLIGIEDTGYQQTLQFWMKKYMTPWMITNIHVVPMKPKNRTKESRIRLFIQELYAQNYYLAPAVRAAFVWQALKYKLGIKKNKDDLLDACAYALDIRNEFWTLIKNNRTTVLLASAAARVISNNTPF